MSSRKPFFFKQQEFTEGNPSHLIATSPVLTHSGSISKILNMWSPLSSLHSIDDNHRSCLSLADDDDEICVMHMYDTHCRRWRPDQSYVHIYPPYRHCYPIGRFSVIMVQCEPVIIYYLRRHFEFYLVVSMDFFHPSGDDKWSSWWRSSYHSQWWSKNFPFLNDHHDDDHFSTVTYRENTRSWHQVAIFSLS